MPFLKVNSESKIVNRNSIYHLPFTIYKRKGFTLIELLVVITIIALLIGVAAASYTKAQQKARDGKRKSDLKAIQQALELYFQQNGKYPAGSTGSIQCNAGSDTTTLTWGTSAFTCNSITYLNLLPKDPTSQTSSAGYYYTSAPTATPPNSYVLSAELENNNDPDRITGTTPCDPEGSRDYCANNP